MKVTWTVTPVGYQRIAKRCPSCKIKRDFTPSGAFRVNSQKKVLDVWSIYKCTHCDYTWNISLFSRLHVSKIDRELHHRLMTNDAATVHHYASDIAMLKRNNAELSGRPDFTVQERWQLSISAHQRVRVSVRISRSFQVTLLSILKQQLMLSTGEIKRHVESGKIRGITMEMLKSRKLKAEEYEFQLSAETLFARRKIVLTHR
ncbi:TPA: DUF1062 domain-containing protein [Klebsiella pneumoniae]|uniref:DUF1062 domain-containing protein n=1 Tax=Enterobacteriaceae TaxID=543 RepID=UPI000E2C47C8|nr:DUF1062 domain-containing protein [Klebsiella pneumoniae]EEQ3417181.1 DUF1062 domain-containing protein [Escherichia coli]EEQ4524186.1 DUF1062 domain-containing protein [Escherichia coli]EER2606118.1 DUF1062 domain-containing protein [Escherichia coli]EET7572738.1 DUF1062 domain-containing protein [Escherichia coli]EEU0207605.1 DUF1062 domain-containing protein [Escherichia coli]